MNTENHDERTQIRERCRRILSASPEPIGCERLAVEAKAARPGLINEALRESSDFRQVAGTWPEKGWRWCMSNSIAAIEARRECVRANAGAGSAGGMFANAKPTLPIIEGDGNGRGLTWESEQLKAKRNEAAVEKVRELMAKGGDFTLEEIRRTVGITHPVAKGAVRLLNAQRKTRKMRQMVEGRPRIQTLTTWTLPKVGA